MIITINNDYSNDNNNHNYSILCIHISSITYDKHAHFEYIFSIYSAVPSVYTTPQPNLVSHPYTPNSLFMFL